MHLIEGIKYLWSCFLDKCAVYGAWMVESITGNKMGDYTMGDVDGDDKHDSDEGGNSGFGGPGCAA